MRGTGKVYTVRAVPWAHGWELHIEGIGVTQSDSLKDADRQVRDYLETLLDEDAADAQIDMVLELGGLDKEAREARAATIRAAEAQREAAARTRAVARRLRERGVKTADAAELLGVSRGRVSQLLADV